MKKHWPVVVFLSIFFVLIASKLIFSSAPFFDWDESLYVQTGKEMIAQSKQGNLIHGEAENLPFPDKSFNTVISVTAFHNFNDMEKALFEIKRVSKNNNIAITFLKKSKKINEFRGTLKKYFKFKEIDCDKDILFLIG